ncbi:hypothetical protein FQA39_LY18770 [Lamprigera yunnana]|nr:hypothetical protein FQA39_LY18770 [Lamprigera yunnana]
MPLVVKSLYVKKYFDTNTNEQIKELIQNVRDEFMNSLQTVKWLDEQTRLHAIAKLDALDIYVGYQEDLIDDKIMESYYKNVELKVDYTGYLNAVLSINAFNQDLVYKRLGPFNKTLWAYELWDGTQADTYYLLFQNQLVVPTGFLQHMVFDGNRPHYMNYAIIGMAIGYEITRCFDDEGRKFDEDGKFNNWWSNQSLLHFKKRAECIEKQYQRYIIPEINRNVNGKLSVGENIADNAGLALSYLAYLRWIKRNGAENPLPGLNYTANQLFWISFAQFMCSYNSKDFLRSYLSTKHIPSRFRVIGTLSNSESFAKDFNCPLNSTMNPKIKCKVW